MANVLFSDRCAVVGAIDPDVTTAGTVYSDYVAAANFESIAGIAMAGTLGSSATFDAALVQATDSSGTGVKAITGASATQLTQAGTDESDSQVVLQCRAEDLDLDNGFDYVALKIVVATATSDAGGVLIGVDPRYAPASGNDHADVAEIATAT